MIDAGKETILIVEDDVGLAELEQTYLERAGYATATATTTQAAMRLLRQDKVALLLLDYRLASGEDGLDFYTQAKAAGYDLPVILVTAFSDEATAIKALRAGVRDFITKSAEYLDFLPEAVARVLNQARTERQLAESEARLNAIIQSAKEAIILVEADRRISLFNPAAEQMFRCPAAEALGQPVQRFIPWELNLPAEEDVAGSPDQAPESLRLALRYGSRGVRADGEVFPLEASVSKGEVAGRTFHTVVIRDITERRRAEERIREQAALLDEANDAILVRNLDDHIVFWNHGAERLYGW